MSFHKLKIILAISLTLFQTPAIIFSKPDTLKPHGDRLIIGSFVEPTIINPILTHSSISAMLKGIVFDGLVKLNDKMEPDPHLAISWENSADGLRWIFYLRKDVTFHNGANLTAEDVKFTFDKIKDPSLNSPYISIFKNFNSLRVEDKYTVEINLTNPLPSLPFYLDVGILPMNLLKGEDIGNCQFNYRPIGTGPFKLHYWSPNEIILKANENYFRGESNISTIIIKIYKEQSIAWAELMKGTVDFVFPPYSKSYDIIEKIPDFTVYSFLNPFYYIVAINEKGRYFSQKEVRQALNYAIDKGRIVTRVLRGKGRVSCGSIYPKSWAYDNSIEPYTYDPKKAIKLLKKAGWQDTNQNHILDKDGKEFEFELLIDEGDYVFQRCALLIQQQLLDIGIRMKVKSLSFPIMYEKFLSKKKFDAALVSIMSDDPDRNYLWWHSSQIDHGFNVFSYRNEKVDELLDKGRIILDKQERIRIYHQFQREIHKDPPGIFLFWSDHLIGIHKRFKGVRVNSAGILRNIHEWYVPEEEQKYR